MKAWKALLIAAAVTAGAAGLMAGCGGAGGASSSNGKVQIGIIQPIEHGSLDASNKGFVAALKENGYTEANTDIDQQNAQGDQSNMKNIISQFVAQKKDLILAIGTPPAQVAANDTKDIPIVGTAIYDYVKANLVKSLDKPGGNVTGTTNANPIPAQLDMYRKIVPGAKRIGLLYSSTEVNSQVQAEAVRAYCKEKGLTLVEATAPSVNDIAQSLQNMVGQVDFIYLPTDNVMAAAIPQIVAVTDPAKIPVFAGADEMAKAGVLASYSVNYYEIGHQAGLMAVKILKKEAVPADMPVEGQKKMNMTINMKDAETLGITIPEEVLKEAIKV